MKTRRGLIKIHNMKKTLSIIALLSFSMCTSENNKAIPQTINKTHNYYGKNINDSTYYIGMMHYHISQPDIDSIQLDTILVIRSAIDSIAFYVSKIECDFLDKNWYRITSHGVFRINNDYSYQFDRSDKEHISIINHKFINNDSLYYLHKRSMNSILETYNFNGKRMPLH